MSKNAGVAQSGRERCSDTAKVGGSNPPTRTAFKVGDIVSLRHNIWCRYGKIVQRKSCYRCFSGKQDWLFTVHYITPETGELMCCPDKRCQGDCAICCEHRWADELVRYGKNELRLFMEAEMLQNELVEGRQRVGLLPG
jgi:threonine dehydrogenase-like Zn-dependent dehydrogenase